MTGGVLGGGVIFVVAAVLWAAVLVPSWVRRREFKAAEQNAVRLQRTLRILAETAEVPTEVRIEATAREALAQEKLLRTAQKQQEAERQAKLAEARAAQVRAQLRAQQMKRQQAALVRQAKLRRSWVRWLRASFALAAVLAVAALFIGAGFAFAGQGALLLAAGALGFIVASGGLVLMAPGRVKLVEIPEEQVVSTEATEVHAVVDQEAERDTAAEAAAHAAAQQAAAARMKRARALARARAEGAAQTGQGGAAERRNQPESMLLERAEAGLGAPRRSEAAEAETTGAGETTPAVAMPASTSVSRSQQLATAERLRKMGVVGDTSDGKLDLDAVFRSRRDAG